MIKISDLNPEERLEEARALKIDKGDYEQRAYSIVVQSCMEKLRKYLVYYNIGYIKDFFLNQHGSFQVLLGINVNNRSLSCSDKRETEKKIFLKQCEILKNEGFTLVEDNSGSYIPDTEANREALINILNPLSPRLTEITSWRNRLKTVSFRVRPSDFENFEVPEIKLHRSDEEEIENKKRYISTLIRELRYLILDIKDMPDSCGNLAEEYFSDLCSALHIKTDMSEKVKSRYRNAKEKLKEADLINKEEANSINLNGFYRNIREYYESLHKVVSDSTGLHVQDVNIREYGYDFVLSGTDIMSAYLYEDFEEEDEEKFLKRVSELEKLYTFVRNDITGEKFIALSDKNIKTIESTIKKYKLGDIQEIKIENLKGQFYIRNIKITGTVLPDIRKGA